MNNVINFPSRQRFKYRMWSRYGAAGTDLGAFGYLILLAVSWQLFWNVLAAVGLGVAGLLTNGAWAWFAAQKVRQDREHERRRQEWREVQAQFQRDVREQEAANLRRAMNAPTRALPIFTPRPEAYVALDDKLRINLLAQLTEQTGDLSAYERPPRRSGAA